MITFSSCQDYKTIATAAHDVDAPKECARLEAERNDGFAVCAWSNGRLVADADGWTERQDGASPYDAATATGMYDRE